MKLLKKFTFFEKLQSEPKRSEPSFHGEALRGGGMLLIQSNNIISLIILRSQTGKACTPNCFHRIAQVNSIVNTENKCYFWLFRS